MILIGLGSNVKGPWGSPASTIRAALKRLDSGPTRLVRTSRLLRSKPMGPVNQPDYINAVAVIATDMAPEALLRHLHDIELDADRRRTVRWGPRTLDLDLLDFNGQVQPGEDTSRGHLKSLELPHPGIPDRDFVLLPIRDVAPQWRHPVSRKSAQDMIDELQAEPANCVFLNG